MSGVFETWTDTDVAELVAAYPLALIISRGADFAATQMPILLDLDANGHPVSLTGHFPRFNPQFMQLRDEPRALFIFQGPHSYISPGLVSKKNWAPTWNFATIRIVADVIFDDSLTDEALERVVAHMEAGNAEPWSVEALGPRYEQLRSAVIGFRAPIHSLTARFKLGQDENPETLAEIVERIDDGPLIQWMRRFNPGRM